VGCLEGFGVGCITTKKQGRFELHNHKSLDSKLLLMQCVETAVLVLTFGAG
jgi:hypothetical protein